MREYGGLPVQAEYALTTENRLFFQRVEQAGAQGRDEKHLDEEVERARINAKDRYMPSVPTRVSVKRRNKKALAYGSDPLAWPTGPVAEGDPPIAPQGFVLGGSVTLALQTRFS